jgi:hypothetical protein
MKSTIILGVAALGLSLTACGSGTGDTSDGLPKCGDVWVAGQTLPKGYSGCTDGSTVEADVTIGKCELTTYRDHFYAIAGGTIRHVDGEIADDAGYRAAWVHCG